MSEISTVTLNAKLKLKSCTVFWPGCGGGGGVNLSGNILMQQITFSGKYHLHGNHLLTGMFTQNFKFPA